MSGMLVLFHTPSNAGYAMLPLEKMFFQVACELFYGQKNVYFGFRDLDKGMPTSLPDQFNNVIAIDPSKPNGPAFTLAAKYVKDNGITAALCFDLQPRSPLSDMLRDAGVQHVFSYWGSTISSENHGVKLFLKRLDVALAKNKPDLFIFESEGMRHLAVYGRGIKKTDTCVIPTGVDTSRFAPDKEGRAYVQQCFGISEGKTIAFYSGHMEARKGVRVIIEAAIKIVDGLGLDHFYFLICGNRPGEEQIFLDMLKGKKAAKNVIFAGYRNDLDKIIPGCDVGLIASTGWDSFPMSSLEMASCGLPLLVSSLQGLAETIENKKTGFLFEPGDSDELAKKLLHLDNDKHLMKRFSKNARSRILNGYSIEHQRVNLFNQLSKIIND